MPCKHHFKMNKLTIRKFIQTPCEKDIFIENFIIIYILILPTENDNLSIFEKKN